MATKTKRNNSPTRRARPKKDPLRRGVKLPDLFVRLKGANSWGGCRDVAARIRNKGGYLYLQYRDGGKVRSHYLGIAKKSSPTNELDQAGGSGAARRAKKRRL